jgi:hypothetical protein
MPSIVMMTMLGGAEAGEDDLLAGDSAVEGSIDASLYPPSCSYLFASRHSYWRKHGL